MISGLIAFCTVWAAGAAESVLITQWPHFVSSQPNASAEMHCYQNNTEYEYLYWYRQQKEDGFRLIVSIVAGSETFEAEFKSGFQAKRSEKKHWSLTITSVQRKDEAVYLCAASLHSDATEFKPVTKTTRPRGVYCFPTPASSDSMKE
ncbi:hypothetical protein LDENG_00101670 [Lucifuga dentata]|nr:hypothetical protein LDENG_00101670 [Lucifuga dentata]